MKRRSADPDVYGYLDYRAYLRDVYAARKAEHRGFSYRAFSMRAGLRSPNHLKRVIDGERSLNAAMAIRYAEALGMTGDQSAYFLDLVAFGESSTDAERNAAHERLRSNRGYRKAQKVDFAHAEHSGSWYVPAIRELVKVTGFEATPEWIASHLVPSISVAEASRALVTLEQLGMLQRAPDGTLVPIDAVVTTGPETRGLHVRNYHRAMLERAAAAMELVPAADRDISTLTFAATDEALHEVKRRIQAFRRELISYVSELPGDRVVQLNLQLFPLSRSDP
ncbi:MAG: TIGR02147 family protein [Myxococcota bacterium]